MRHNVEANRRRSGAGASGLAVGVCYPPWFSFSKLMAYEVDEY